MESGDWETCARCRGTGKSDKVSRKGLSPDTLARLRPEAEAFRAIAVEQFPTTVSHPIPRVPPPRDLPKPSAPVRNERPDAAQPDRFSLLEID
jgi:hypothetical protein